MSAAAGESASVSLRHRFLAQVSGKWTVWLFTHRRRQALPRRRRLLRPLISILTAPDAVVVHPKTRLNLAEKSRLNAAMHNAQVCPLNLDTGGSSVDTTRVWRGGVWARQRTWWLSNCCESFLACAGVLARRSVPLVDCWTRGQHNEAGKGSDGGEGSPCRACERRTSWARIPARGDLQGKHRQSSSSDSKAVSTLGELCVDTFVVA